MKIVEVEDQDLKRHICEDVLRRLPLWFGIESAIVDYVRDVAGLETWVAYEQNSAIGFASITRHFSQSAEIHVMGVIQDYHRRGVGRQLIEAIQKALRAQGFKFLTVKTLSESRPNKEYELTRNFYLKNGFVPLEEFKTLWGESNPCLLLIKSL